MKYLYKYPQAAFPYAQSRRNQPPPEPPRVRVRIARYRRVRSGSLLRRVRGVRQGVARGHPDPDHASTTAARKRPSCTSCRRSGSATSGPGMRTPTGRAWPRPTSSAGAERRQGDRSQTGRTLSLLRRRARRCCSPRTKPTRSASSASPTARPTSRTASTTTSSTARTEAVNPGAEGNEGRGPLSADRRPRAKARWFGCGSATSPRPPLVRATGKQGGPSAAIRRSAASSPHRRPTSSTHGIIPRSLNADQANVMRQALAGMLWSKQFYHYDVDKWLEERGSDPFKPTRKAAPRNDHWHHMYNGDVISMPDKWEYPWYAAWDLAFHVDRPDAGGCRFRQAATEADAARALHAPQRPDSRLRVELRRRQPAGPCLVHHLHLSPGKGARRARATRTGSRAASRSCCSTSPGGSTARTARVATSSRAASSAWTTSACSIAARRCRPAATWSRPTAPPGWRCSARTCSKSPSSWR